MKNTIVSSEAKPGKAIYDFGMNNGDDVEYYLKKGMKVVGVEANPELCEECRKRFPAAISDGSFVILNVALTSEQHETTVPFWIHRKYHFLSRFPKPSIEEQDKFLEISVEAKRASDIVKEHGAPHYIKLDVEHYDQKVLADLFSHDIYPDFLSAEAHSVQVFCLMVSAGYRSFNLVDGSTVHIDYSAATISTPTGIEQFAFRHHSAGPFADDIASPWYNEDSFFYILAKQGLGWKDVHASKYIVPAAHPTVHIRKPQLTIGEHLRDFGPSLIRSVSYRFRRRQG